MEKDKYVGISKVGEKGQIVIPKEAREMFGIHPGDSIVVLCDRDKGMALVKSDVIESFAVNILDGGKQDDRD
ncbi:conserved domain protein [Mycoplasma sp. CAG:776]|nr:conserved domain protein [Mycoplasma sp. CAG:776]